MRCEERIGPVKQHQAIKLRLAAMLVVFRVIAAPQALRPQRTE